MRARPVAGWQTRRGPTGARSRVLVFGSRSQTSMATLWCPTAPRPWCRARTGCANTRRRVVIQRKVHRARAQYRACSTCTRWCATGFAGVRAAFDAGAAAAAPAAVNLACASEGAAEAAVPCYEGLRMPNARGDAARAVVAGTWGVAGPCCCSSVARACVPPLPHRAAAAVLDERGRRVRRRALIFGDSALADCGAARKFWHRPSRLHGAPAV